ncbi:DUF5677 domain-containing protein [Liquorilactobacillus cacaonum]|uniref:Uncharacterized protein n=1 Tax=Liquorilactobacillus cacaonum DSM 21116 TaxID=1423729 RepID=A0A0R2CTC9_9LACO|nr:DUF5677 domain-containing protein [Liquorilactobacillus cacaonum]KRM91481.1 hypothetical protein FC80_GL000448 [Liquorilactobacillus cacaonum DSM 21116]
MSLKSTIKDCQTLIEFDNGDVLKEKDIVIFSLFSGLNEKAKTINVLDEAKQYSDFSIIVRSFIEQLSYLNYILKENTVNRAQMYLMFQKYNDCLKVKKYIELPTANKDEVEKFKEKINIKIKKDDGNFNSFEDQFNYFEAKYIELLPPDTKPERTSWYSVENNKKNGINNFRELMNDLEMLPVYLGLYATMSNAVHGSDATSHFEVIDENTFGYVVNDMNEIVEMVDAYLRSEFISVAKYYRILNKGKFKAIYEKFKINASFNLKNF